MLPAVPNRSPMNPAMVRVLDLPRTNQSVAYQSSRDELPLTGIEWRNGKPVAALQSAQVFQFWMLAQFTNGDERNLLYQLHIDIEPARGFLRCFGVEVFALPVELRGIGISSAAYLCDTGDARFLAVGVVEQYTVAGLHLVAHEVACLIIAHAVPCDGLIGQRSEIVDAAVAGFGFHQPITHDPIPQKKSAIPKDRTGMKSPACAVDSMS